MRRIRREMANLNQRKTQQKIDDGIQSLRSLLPHPEAGKLTKVSISVLIPY